MAVVNAADDPADALEQTPAARALGRQQPADRQRLYRVLADYAAEVAGLSVGGVIVWVAPSITDMLGWSVDEFVGRTIASFVHPDDIPDVFAFRQQVDQGSRRRIRCRMSHKDGSWRWIETSSRRASPEDVGVDDAVVSMLWDVHAEVEAVAALERAEGERAEMRARMQQAERLESLGVLAGGIAHDFNNLLMGVMGNVELALARTSDPAMTRLLDQIVVASKRAAGLTRQLLDYAGKRTFETQLVALADVVEDTLELIRPLISRTATATVAVPADLPPVLGDPVQLRQVLVNLVINASDALEGHRGEIVVRGSTRNVDVADAVRLSPTAPIAPGEYVAIEIADTGRGMSAEHVQRMFEPFFTTKAAGKGLGLSVVHGVVRTIGGAIEVTSAVGTGTTVRVLLPANVPIEPASDPAPVGKVLVVDDDRLVLDVVTEVLTSFGYDVVDASDPRDAIEIFASDPDRFVAALIDVTMPELSGPEVLAALRGIRPRLPAVIMSGYSPADIRVDTSDGHTGFLQKPFGIDMLLDATASSVAAWTDVQRPS